MAVVKEYKLSNTTVRIHDDSYKNKTQEDINEIIRKLKEIGGQILSQMKKEVI